MAFYANLVHFPPLYNTTLLVVFNIPIFTKHNQSLIFIIVFVQNESNNFMYACDGALLIFRVTLTMTLIHCGLRLRTLFTRYLRDDKSNVLSIFMLGGSI